MNIRPYANTDDRILATLLSARWVYSADAGGLGPLPRPVRETLVGVFAKHKSLAVQQTLQRDGRWPLWKHVAAYRANHPADAQSASYSCQSGAVRARKQQRGFRGDARALWRHHGDVAARITTTHQCGSGMRGPSDRGQRSGQGQPALARRCAIASGELYSSGRWLMPSLQGMKIMPDGTKPGHEQRIVIGPADHGLACQMQVRAGRLQSRPRPAHPRAAGGSALSSVDFRRSPRRSRDSLRCLPAPARTTRSRAPRSISRMSISSVTRLGMLLMAPGCTWQTPVVATVSARPLASAAASTASTTSAAAQQGILALGHQHRPGVAALAF